MNSQQKEVLRNIIYAVETGGQILGNKRYDDFTEAYTNSDIEYAITIGAGQWYGTEALRLLKLIRSTDPSVFKKLDTAGIGNDLDTCDWSQYRVSKTSSKAKCIQKIIDTPIGHQCQDQLVDEQMEQYINEASGLGVTDVAAQMMCANFRHQGGYSAMKRVVGKTSKPYTLDNLYAACQTDTGNQVGAYKSRQKMVYAALKSHIDVQTTGGGNMGVTKEQAINALIAVAQNEVGYLEKASNAQLDSKTANAGYNNYTKYWRDCYSQYQAQPWCGIFVDWCMRQAFGAATAKALLKHQPYTYCPTLGNLFTKYANPEVGDVVIFWRNGEFAHTGIVVAVKGDYFETIEGNTSSGSTIVPNGGGVYRKSYYNSSLPGTKFCRPDYSLVTSLNTGGTTPPPKGFLSKGDNSPAVKDLQTKLIAIGFSCGASGADGDYGEATEQAIFAFQRKYKLEVDGCAGPATMEKLNELYNTKVNPSPTPAGDANVKAAQTALNRSFNAGLEVDGSWGANSKKAYIRALQTALNRVYGSGLVVDGVWGSNTGSACARHYQYKGCNNLVVGVLQIGLYAHDISLVSGIDCDFGASTERGVKAFQKSVGLAQDGQAGRDTFAKLVA